MKIGQKITHVIIHILFWMIFIYFFTHYSCLRPMVIKQTYIEYLCAFLLIFMAYVNYLYLIPKYFQRGNVAKYWIFAVLIIMIAGLGEFLLTGSNTYECSISFIPSEMMSTYLLIGIGMIVLRDIGIFLFVFLFRVYQDLSHKYLLEKQFLAQKERILVVTMQPQKIMQEIRISDIVYIEQDRNNSIFHLIDGTIYKQQSSLKQLENDLPKEVWLRINKSIIIMISQVIDYDEDYVRMNFKNNEEIILPITEIYKNTALQELKRHITFFRIPISNIEELKQKNEELKLKTENNKDEIMMKIDVNGEIMRGSEELKLNEKEEKMEIIEIFTEKQEEKDIYTMNHTAKKILSFVKDNPNVQMAFIAEKTNTSKKSVERYTSELIHHKLIERRGSRKTGGYYAIENEPDH